MTRFLFNQDADNKENGGEETREQSEDFLEAWVFPNDDPFGEPVLKRFLIIEIKLIKDQIMKMKNPMRMRMTKAKKKRKTNKRLNRILLSPYPTRMTVMRLLMTHG